MKYTFFTLLVCALFSCKDAGSDADKEETGDVVEQPIQQGPVFNENNAYQYIEKQVAFGPRVPGTAAHKKTAQYLTATLSGFADTVYEQNTTLLLADQKTKVPCFNIIASFNPKATKRLLLLAHWDTRPWADQDFKNREQPIDGADDGGSGVGVLLEIARLLKAHPLQQDALGVDILLADVEDYAKSEWGSDAYALGTQYWAKKPHLKGYTATEGILLDMVGAKNARFAIEYYSQLYAKDVMMKVWEKAHELGYGDFFVYENGAGINDDHIPVNEIAKIPTIDIINQPEGSSTGFVGHWHTHDDNMSIIDKKTLKAVGQTVVSYIYSQQ